MDEVRQIWNDLKLNQLLTSNEEEQLPLAMQALLNSGQKTKEKIILEHKKTWKKPNYNVLTDRYASRPHDPPVLNTSKLKKLADPLRGKYASFDKLMLEEDDSEEERGHEKNYRYKDSEMTPSSGQAYKNKSLSPSNRSSAFFLTAAGSDDDAADDTKHIARQRREVPTFNRGGTVSKFRGKLEEAKRDGAMKEKLSRPLLSQKRQDSSRAPALQRKKSGRFPTAPMLGVGKTAKKSNNSSFTHIKSSIPPPQPPARRKAASKIFNAGPMNLNGSYNGKKVSVRRGAAPKDAPLGLDLSNVSSNAGGGLAERRAARLARADSTIFGATRSKDTADLASGGGVSAASRIRAARAGRPSGGVKTAPPQLSTVEEMPRRQGKITSLPDRTRDAAHLPVSSATGVRRKSFSIDPLLSPTRQRATSGATAGAGVSRALSKSSSNRSLQSSPRSKPVTGIMLRSNTRESLSPRGEREKPQISTAPIAGTAFAASSANDKNAEAVDMQTVRSNLEKVQAREAVRMMPKEAETSAAALLAQAAKRLNSQFDKAREMSAKYDHITDDKKVVDYTPFLPRRQSGGGERGGMVEKIVI